MPDDSRSRSSSATPSSAEPDYDAIQAAIVATATGRWFLDEYARRQRGVDSDLVLAALQRIERAVAGAAANAATPTAPPRPELADSIQTELAAMAETIRQIRAEVIGRHGDPAASGEAAALEFRNAVEQIQELARALRAPEGASELVAQMSFQTSRLAGAGDRLERSMAALRTLLGLLDDFDQRLRRLGLVTASAAATAAEPSPGHAEDPQPASEATVSERASGSEDAAHDAAPAEELPPQRDLAATCTLPPADQPTNALERLEAREYGRRLMSTAVVAPAGQDQGPERAQIADASSSAAVPPATTVEPSPAYSLDDLVLDSAPEPGEGAVAVASETSASDMEWTIEPTAAAAEALFDADLFGDSDEGNASRQQPEAPTYLGRDFSLGDDDKDPQAFAPQPPGPPLFTFTMPEEPGSQRRTPAAMPKEDSQAPPPRPEPSGRFPEPAVDQAQPLAGANAEPTVSERLENVRTAIAALMDEVSAKTAGRSPR